RIYAAILAAERRHNEAWHQIGEAMQTDPLSHRITPRLFGPCTTLATMTERFSRRKKRCNWIQGTIGPIFGWAGFTRRKACIRRLSQNQKASLRRPQRVIWPSRRWRIAWRRQVSRLNHESSCGAWRREPRMA